MATILIVDDKALNREFLVTLLGYSGHTLAEAADGVEALAEVARHKPDLVISDILMPNMDGEEFVRRLRADPATRDLPVIFYTATYRMREARTIAERVGVPRVLSKPSEPKLIMDTVAQALGLPPSTPVLPGVEAIALAAQRDSGQFIGERLSAVEDMTRHLSLLLESALDIAAQQATSLASVRPLELALHDVQSLGLRLTGLIELGQVIASQRDTADLVATFCRASQDILSARYAGVVMLDPADCSLQQFAALGLDAAERTDVAAEIAYCPAQERVLAAGKPLRLDGDDGGICVVGLPPSHPPVRSFLACPVIALGQTCGWMYVADRLGMDGFRSDDESIAVTLAAQLAITWENLKLHEDLEQRVALRTRELEAANKELEAFSYSVSHDLRAPLRAIDGFSLELMEDYNEKLDDEGRRYLSQVRSSAQRMGELIDDLLQLSKVSRAELRCEPVDLSSLAREVLDSLRRSQPHRNVMLVIEDGLVAVADRRLMRVVLENLLGNAWKFTSKASEPRVAFGLEKHEGVAAYYVRDNGAGFDMAYAGKLFQAFQRMHGEADFPGTGIGLATVHRIIDRHGGRVWAEGKPDAGASFFFTLPES